MGIISDTHSVRIKPEVNLGGLGASHDPLGGLYTSFWFKLAPKMGYLLWEIDRYDSDVTVTRKKILDYEITKIIKPNNFIAAKKYNRLIK